MSLGSCSVFVALLQIPRKQENGKWCGPAAGAQWGWGISIPRDVQGIMNNARFSFEVSPVMSGRVAWMTFSNLLQPPCKILIFYRSLLLMSLLWISWQIGPASPSLSPLSVDSEVPPMPCPAFTWLFLYCPLFLFCATLCTHVLFAFIFIGRLDFSGCVFRKMQSVRIISKQLHLKNP